MSSYLPPPYLQGMSRPATALTHDHQHWKNNIQAPSGGVLLPDFLLWWVVCSGRWWITSHHDRSSFFRQEHPNLIPPTIVANSSRRLLPHKLVPFLSTTAASKHAMSVNTLWLSLSTPHLWKEV